MANNVLISIDGQKGVVSYRHASGALFSTFIPFLDKMDRDTLRRNIQASYWTLQCLDRAEFKRTHLKSWKWLRGVMVGEYDKLPIIKFITNSHLASINMGLLAGFGLAKGYRSKGRMKIDGDPYSDPERSTIYPDITSRGQKWPKCLIEAAERRAQGKLVRKRVSR